MLAKKKKNKGNLKKAFSVNLLINELSFCFIYFKMRKKFELISSDCLEKYFKRIRSDFTEK